MGNCVFGQCPPASASRILATLCLLLLTASSALAQTTVTAQWNRNSDNQTAGYRLYYGTAPGSHQWSVDAGNQTSAPISLSPGSVYYFVVRAYTASVEYGAPSNEASIDLRSGTTAATADITASMQAANTALVTWQTANAVRVTLNGSLLNAASGSASVHVTSTTTFTLVATDAAGANLTRSATVTPSGSGGTPPPPPLPPTPTPSGPTAQITASLLTPNTALLTWQTANATRATINGAPLNAASGTASVHITGTATFTLVATNAAGIATTQSATVTAGGTTGTPPPSVPPPSTPPPSSGMTAQLTGTLQTPNTALITWNTANATRATINGAPLNAASGTASVHINGTTTFTLVATDAAGASVTRSATVTAGTTASGPTAQITASLQTPNTALITWYVANATRATINGTPLNAATGTASVYVSGTTTFTLVATDATGASVTRSATVSR